MVSKNRVRRLMARKLYRSSKVGAVDEGDIGTVPDKDEQMKFMKSTALLAGLLAVSGCGLAEARQRTPDLAGYVDHYPFDRVNGVTFRANPLVVAGVRRAVTDAKIREAVLENDDVVDTPILQLSEGRLYADSFDPKGGGSTNWAILITADGSKTAVCFSDDAVYGEGTSTWYYEGEVAFVQDGPCPGEKDDIEARFGTWPVGSIPG